MGAGSLSGVALVEYQIVILTPGLAASGQI